MGISVPARAAVVWRVNAVPSGVAYVPVNGYDEEKIPLVFIHGINHTIRTEETQALTDRLAQDPMLAPYFQVFTVEYPTHDSIDANGRALAGEIARTLGRRKFVLVGHSMGGLVARASLELYGRSVEGYDLMDQCFRLITMGTPHHGTPFASLPWVEEMERREPALKSFREQAVQTTGLTLDAPGVREMAWDGFDGQTPSAALSGKSGFLEQLNANFPNVAGHASRKYAFFGGTITRRPVSFLEFFNREQGKATQYQALGYLLHHLVLPENDTYAASDGMVPLSSALYLIPVEKGSPDERIARVTDGGDETTRIDVVPSAMASRAPAIRRAEAFADVLHHFYPLSDPVYRAIRSELRLEETLTGDLNGDGSVNVSDALVGLQCVVGLRPTGLRELLPGDEDRDGRISVAEVVRVLRLSVGLL